MDTRYKIGYNIKVAETGNFYKLTQREPVHVEKSYSEIGAGGESGYMGFDVIKAPSDTFYFLKIGLKQDVKLEAKLPTAIQRWGINKSPIGFVNQSMSPADDPSEEFIFIMPPDKTAKLNIVNNSSLIAVTPEIEIHGYKYSVKELSREPDKYTTVSIESFGGR